MEKYIKWMKRKKKDETGNVFWYLLVIKNCEVIKCTDLRESFCRCAAIWLLHSMRYIVMNQCDESWFCIIENYAN